MGHLTTAKLMSSFALVIGVRTTKHAMESALSRMSTVKESAVSQSAKRRNAAMTGAAAVVEAVLSVGPRV